MTSAVPGPPSSSTSGRDGCCATSSRRTRRATRSPASCATARSWSPWAARTARASCGRSWAFNGLVREAGAFVTGIALSAEPARIVYTRLLSVIQGNATLRARFERLADELHLMKAALWSDLVNGTAACRNGIVAGITTAGDDQTDLLKTLYQTIDEGPGERYGFVVWEAPEAKVLDDEDTS